MLIKEGDTIFRDAEYMPDFVQPIKDQVFEASFEENNDFIKSFYNIEYYLNTAPNSAFSVVLTYSYALYMDELDIKEVKFSKALTAQLLKRLFFLYYMYVKEKLGFVRSICTAPIYNDSLDCFQLTEYGVAYELFRTNSQLSLPAITDIIVTNENIIS